MLPIHLQSGVPRYHHWWFNPVLTKNPSISRFMYTNNAPKPWCQSAETCTFVTFSLKWSSGKYSTYWWFLHWFFGLSLQWRHNECDGVSDQQPHDCLLNRLFTRRWKKTSTSLAFVRGIHRWPLNSPHKGPVTRKMFPFDDVIIMHAPTRYHSIHIFTLTALDIYWRNNFGYFAICIYRFRFSILM